jgi:hypothetical protein
MSNKQEHEQQFPVRLTLAQRKVVAEVFSQFSERLRLDERNERMVSFTLDEMRAIHQKARVGVHRADSGMKRTSLRHVRHVTETSEIAGVTTFFSRAARGLNRVGDIRSAWRGKEPARQTT